MDRRDEVEALFEAALERPAAERDAWLEAATGDAWLRAEVRALLAAHERAAGILELPGGAVARLLGDRPAEAPERVGPYRLVRPVGRGGMATVYLAERDDAHFRQQVALKLVRRGLDTADLVERFRAERQILASLQHPHIARLLDGGVAEDGRPYLAMEFVDGEPVDRWCDARRLSVEDRLRLFARVARAVHHAHRSLVVHRDLKPSNILVTADGHPRLVDFGIAKILDPDAVPGDAPLTRAGVRPMTPEYAAPEQVRGEPVTTATDVWGLGVVLYELLTGVRPFRGSTPMEVEWRVRDAEPEPPSAAVLRAAADADTDLDPEARARARGTQPARLRRALRGDLDRIVAMALRREPERRYDSAEQLADDVERHLAGRPVRARGGHYSYRAGKFVRRNAWALAGAAAFVALLAGYAVTVTVQAREVRAALEQAREEAEENEQVAAFLVRLFESTDPARDPGDTVTAGVLLARGVERAERLRGQPSAQAQALDVIGRVHQSLGRFDEAERLLERSLAIRRTAFGDRHPGVAESLHHLAALHAARGEYATAEPLFHRALAIQRARFAPDDPRTARTLHGLSLLLADRGDYAGAERTARQALEIHRRAHAGPHPEVAASLRHLAGMERRKGDYAASEALFRETLAMRRALYGEEHPEVGESLADLAYIVHLRGDFAGAEPLYRRALALNRALLGERHPTVAAGMSNLGLLLFQRDDLAAAEPLYREALARRQRIYGPLHPDVATSQALLGGLLRRKGEMAGAEALYRQAVDVARRSLGPEHPDLAHHMNGLALVLRERGDLASADSIFRAVLAMRRRLLGERHPAVAATLVSLGINSQRRGAFPEAEAQLRAAVDMRRDLLGPRHPDTFAALRDLAALYAAWGRPALADSLRRLLPRDSTGR